jgi:hypothetical protein
VVVLVVASLAITTARHFAPLLHSSACVVHGRSYAVPLTAGQAGIAATIAGVADQRSMPERAVTIAYAAALQESDLENLSYGDRDSVGVFQQRPSQGWGTRAQLLDPVYASTRFFGALAHVTGYQHLQIYQAAQAVQHSADGYAYSQFASQGTQMADGFSGERAHAVWCWYGSVARPARLAAASRALAKTFGPLRLTRAGDPTMLVRVKHPSAGWAVAAWLVSHADSYGIRTVRFHGFAWSVTHGQKGWVKLGPSGHHPAASRTVVFG